MDSKRLVLILSDDETASTVVQLGGCRCRSPAAKLEVNRGILSRIEKILTLGSVVESRGVAFSWGSQKVQGVSLGGWLVLEGHVTRPSGKEIG
jgi:hypothetical protein